MTYQLQDPDNPVVYETIEQARPELDGFRTTEHVNFVCPDCGTHNGSNVFLDGDAPVVVCGDCWIKHALEDVQ